jgi:biotin transporter BioY
MGRAILWALLGLILGGALAFGLGLLWLTYINTDNREGAASMGVIFFCTPAGAVLGMLAGLIAALLRRR